MPVVIDPSVTTAWRFTDQAHLPRAGRADSHAAGDVRRRTPRRLPGRRRTAAHRELTGIPLYGASDIARRTALPRA